MFFRCTTVDAWHVANCLKGVGEGFFEGCDVTGCSGSWCWCVMVLWRGDLCGVVL